MLVRILRLLILLCDLHSFNSSSVFFNLNAPPSPQDTCTSTTPKWRDCMTCTRRQGNRSITSRYWESFESRLSLLARMLEILLFDVYLYEPQLCDYPRLDSILSMYSRKWERWSTLSFRRSSPSPPCFNLFDMAVSSLKISSFTNYWTSSVFWSTCTGSLW